MPDLLMLGFEWILGRIFCLGVGPGFVAGQQLRDEGFESQLQVELELEVGC